LVNAKKLRLQNIHDESGPKLVIQLHSEEVHIDGKPLKICYEFGTSVKLMRRRIDDDDDDKSRDISVCIATGYGLDDRMFGVRIPAGVGIFLFTTVSIPALGSIHPRIQWVLESLSLGIKRPGREADHSPPSSAEVKECVELYLHSPNTCSWLCA
jgi:hypothetical protein